MLLLKLFAFGTISLYIGMSIFNLQSKHKRITSYIVTGTVIGYEKSKGKDFHGRTYRKGGDVYTPIFEYCIDGVVRQVRHYYFTSNYNTIVEKFPKGSEVELVVDKNNLDNAVLNTKFSINMQNNTTHLFSVISIILIILGAALYLIGILSFLLLKIA